MSVWLAKRTPLLGLRPQIDDTYLVNRILHASLLLCLLSFIKYLAALYLRPLQSFVLIPVNWWVSEVPASTVLDYVLGGTSNSWQHRKLIIALLRLNSYSDHLEHILILSEAVESRILIEGAWFCAYVAAIDSAKVGMYLFVVDRGVLHRTHSKIGIEVLGLLLRLDCWKMLFSRLVNCLWALMD